MSELEFDEEVLGDAAYREGGAVGLAAASVDGVPALRFFDNLRRAALESFDRSASVGATPTVFVLSEQRARIDARKVDPAAARLTDINLRQPGEWEGRLVFTAPHGTGGWATPLPCGSADAAIDLLEQHGFGHLPVAIIYPQTRALSCYQEGGVSEKAPIRLDLPARSRPVTIADIFEVLEDVRRNSLLTPQIGPPGFWSKPEVYQPGPEAERQIQWVVAAQLRSSFRPMIVDTEQVVPEGRIDIVVTNPAPTPDNPLHPAVVELKALKSKSHTGAAFADTKNVKAVIKGLRQAKSYREAKQARFSVLGCFDMRQDKTDIMGVNVCVLARNRYLTDDRVRAFVFPLFGTTDDAQEATATA